MATDRNTLTEASDASQDSRPEPLWRNHNYLLLWSGQAISAVGGEASQLAFPLLILSLTHSPAQAGFAGALRSLAYLLLGLPAGALVDLRYGGMGGRGQRRAASAPAEYPSGNSSRRPHAATVRASRS